MSVIPVSYTHLDVYKRQEYGWKVQKSVVLKASFPLTYAECVKSEATSGGREESL